MSDIISPRRRLKRETKPQLPLMPSKKKPMPKCLIKAQKEYTKRNLAKGFIKMALWVPKENAEEMRSIAKEMRMEAEEEMNKKYEKFAEMVAEAGITK